MTETFQGDKIRLKKNRDFHAARGLSSQNRNAARYLDPKYSRWMSADPAVSDYMDKTEKGVGGIYNIANLNVYHYGGNNPLKYKDPTGRNATYSVDDESGTININVDIVIFNEAGDMTDDEMNDLANTWQDGINSAWGGEHTAQVNGKDYKVSVNANVRVGSAGDVKKGVGTNYVNVIKGNGRSSCGSLDPNAETAEAGNFGAWFSGDPDAGYMAAHEAGHLMGLGDRYTDVCDTLTGEALASLPDFGWNGNIMGEHGGAVEQRNIQGIATGIQERMLIRPRGLLVSKFNQ